MIILDTNVLSELIRSTPNPTVVEWFGKLAVSECRTTSISFAEMMFGARSLPEGKRRDALTALVVELFENQFGDSVLVFDVEAAKAYGEVVASRRRAGRPMGTMDAEIASIALSQGASVATRDVEGFGGLGLTLINPWEA
jgi:predicted nucleic acid-binding protein